MKRIIALLVTTASAAVLALGAAPAMAVTSGCAPGVVFCQGLTLQSPVLAMAAAGAVTGDAVLVAAPDGESPAQDWYVHSPPGGGYHVRTFEFAPGGIRSGLCVSEPNVAVRTVIVLRKCRAASPYQTWREIDVAGAPGGNFYGVWKNLASGLALADPNSGGPGTQLQSRHVGTGSALNERWTNQF